MYIRASKRAKNRSIGDDNNNRNEIQRKILGSSRLDFAKVLAMLSKKNVIYKKMFLYLAKPRYAYAIEKSPDFLIHYVAIGIKQSAFCFSGGKR
jgi:hypothetical protein